nr:MAG TPA: hypothetical protein [Caudoviricetes sp.]
MRLPLCVSLAKYGQSLVQGHMTFTDVFLVRSFTRIHGLFNFELFPKWKQLVLGYFDFSTANISSNSSVCSLNFIGLPL